MSLLPRLSKRILRDLYGKDRDLRSARCTGEIPRDNSEPRPESFPSSQSARVEKDGQNQGGFLGGESSLRDSVPAIIALYNKDEKGTYGATLFAFISLLSGLLDR